MQQDNLFRQKASTNLALNSLLILKMQWLFFGLALAVLLWLPMQNIIIALLYSTGILPSTVARAILFLKELILIILLVALIISGRTLRWSMVEFAFFFFVVWVIGHLPFGDLPLITQFAGIRMMVIPLLVYFLGRYIPVPDRGLVVFWMSLLFVFICTVIVGYIEYLFISDTQLSILQYAMLQAKGQTAVDFYLVNNFGGLFYTAFGSAFEGNLIWVRRMTATYLEPLAFGHALILPIIFLFYIIISPRPIPIRPRWLIAILLVAMSLAQLLAISRGALLASAIGIASVTITMGKISRKRIITLAILTTIILLTIPPIRGYLWNTIRLEDPSSRGHLYQLQKGWELLLREPFGFGLGHGGYVGTQFGGGDAEGSGESFYFSMISQVGLLGLLIFAVGLILLILQMWKCSQSAYTSLWLRISTIVTMASLAGLSVSAIASEAAFGMLASAYVWFMAGVVVQLYHQQRRRVNQPDNPGLHKASVL